ncbi:MAG: hypothetical protein WDW38_010173 [Sanguina aurantia]
MLLCLRAHDQVRHVSGPRLLSPITHRTRTAADPGLPPERARHAARTSSHLEPDIASARHHPRPTSPPLDTTSARHHFCSTPLDTTFARHYLRSTSLARDITSARHHPRPTTLLLNITPARHHPRTTPTPLDITPAGQFQDLLQRLSFRLRDAFLPDPRDVTPDYWEWCRWRLTQRMRFITSLIFTACMSGEFLTPIFPDYFVLLASIANIGRAVGLTAFVATQPAFQQALCTGGNLADLTSKSQIASNENLLQPANVWGGALPLSITPLDRLVRQPSQLLPLLKRYSQDRYMLRLQLLDDKAGSSSSSSSSVSGISSALQDSQNSVGVTGSSSSKAGGSGAPVASSGSSSGGSGGSGSSGCSGGGGGGEASTKGGGLMTALSDARQGLRMPWQAEPQPRILVSLWLMSAMSEAQWKVKPFMLSTMEKVMYVRLDTNSSSAASKTPPGSKGSKAPVVREVQ